MPKLPKLPKQRLYRRLKTKSWQIRNLKRPKKLLLKLQLLKRPNRQLPIKLKLIRRQLHKPKRTDLQKRNWMMKLPPKSKLFLIRLLKMKNLQRKLKKLKMQKMQKLLRKLPKPQLLFLQTSVQHNRKQLQNLMLNKRKQKKFKKKPLRPPPPRKKLLRYKHRWMRLLKQKRLNANLRQLLPHSRKKRRKKLLRLKKKRNCKFRKL